MNREPKGTQIFIALSIFFFFSVFSVYLLYNNCVEIDFPSSKPKFENLDQDYLLDNTQNKSEMSSPSASSVIGETNLFQKLSYFSFQKSLLDQKPLFLRC